MSPARRRASVMSASRRVSVAFSVASASRRSADDRVRVRGSHLGDERRAHPTRGVVRPPARSACGRDPRRALHEHVEGILQRELELFGPDGKQQREDRIPQQARFREVGARDPEVRRASPETTGCSTAQSRRPLPGSGRPRGSHREEADSRRRGGCRRSAVRARIAVSTSAGDGAPPVVAHPAPATTRAASHARAIAPIFTIRDPPPLRQAHRRRFRTVQRRYPHAINHQSYKGACVPDV